MEDDTEILDWGNEEEERNTVGGVQRSVALEEDAVSLGGDEEEDEFLAHQSRVPQGTKSTNRSQTPSRLAEPSAKGMVTDTRQRRGAEPVRPDTPPKHLEKTQQSSTLPLSLGLGTLTHALPAKPVSSMPFVHPSHPPIIEATAMGSHSDRNKRNGGAPSTHSHDNGDSLPSGWEIKWSRSTSEVYYYNTRTEESTWTCPDSPSLCEAHSYRPEGSLDRGLSSRNGDIPSRKGRSDGDDLSYDDRHYRPAENGRRDDRSTQTYSGDSYQTSNRQNGPSLLPSRTRDDERGPPSRRPHSPPSGRDSVQSTRCEAPVAAALSSQDRIWIASDVIVQPRERERRQHDSGVVPSDYDRRHSRDTDKSSTLSTLSTPSPSHLHIPTSIGRQDSSRGGGQSMKQTSCEALGVELRCTIPSSFLFDLLAWTHGRLSWITIFYPFLPVLCLSPSPLFTFFRYLLSRTTFARHLFPRSPGSGNIEQIGTIGPQLVRF